MRLPSTCGCAGVARVGVGLRWRGFSLGWGCAGAVSCSGGGASARLRPRVGLRRRGFDSSCAPKGPRPGGWQRRRLGFSGCGLLGTQESALARPERWICHRIALGGGSVTFSALYRWRIHRRRGQAWQGFCVREGIPSQTQKPWHSRTRTQILVSTRAEATARVPDPPLTPAARSRPFRRPDRARVEAAQQHDETPATAHRQVVKTATARRASTPTPPARAAPRGEGPGRRRGRRAGCGRRSRRRGRRHPRPWRGRLA